MIKFLADVKDKDEVVKTLFLGLSKGNLRLLKEGKPIKIVGSEIGYEMDIVIFYGKTEADMMKDLTEAGVKLPEKAGIHYDDQRQQGGTGNNQ